MKNYIVAEQGELSLIGLAAKELRRYLYVLGEEIPEIVREIPKSGNIIILGVKGNPILEKYKGILDYEELNEDGYLLYGTGMEDGVTILTGKSPISVLYAVYRFLELQGLRFYLHGDLIPDGRSEQCVWNMRLNLKESPLFKERGVLPFHDFPEGPDWWNKDDYSAVITQLPKMRANFFALHTYPENKEAPKAMTAEPLVWIGRKEDCEEDGTVKASYPVQHFKTNGNSWGYHPMKTRDYPCGTGNIFEKDCYGADYMAGYEEDIYSEEIHGAKVPADKYNQMFNAYGEVLAETFSYAKKLAVKTCIGIEVPLTIPQAVRTHLGIGEVVDQSTIETLYEGIFERIKRTHPLDYFWMWTPEDWTWIGNSREETEKTIRDFDCALKAIQKTDAAFSPAVCGWTLGPQEDRAAFDNYLPKSIPFSCINRNVGFDPIEPKFQDLKERPTWAIPWMEDDPAMISPQLWVGRMRRDSYDAKRYGCDGLLGIHWRTRNIAPNIKALMDSAWEQEWAKDMPNDICLEGYVGNESFVEEYPDCEGIFCKARKGMSEYKLKIPPGKYKVSLIFQSDEVKLDVKVKNLLLRDVDLTGDNQQIIVPGIEVEQDTLLTIKFMEKSGHPALAAIVIQGATKNNQLAGNDYSRKINCGGEKYRDYEADLELYKEDGRSGPVEDFYKMFAEAEFGKEAGEEAADIFSGLDGYLPRPSRWEDGPGNIYCNEISWEDIQEQYNFVDEFERLDARVRGAGNKGRYNYWNHTFQAMKRTDQIGCLWGEFEKNYQCKNHESSRLVYEKLLKIVEELNYHLLMGLETYGDIGVLTNIQQRSITPILNQCREKLEKWYQELPKPLGNVVGRASKLVVPTVRTSLQRGENLRLKVIVIGGSDAAPILSIRNLGAINYREVPFEIKERWVYFIDVPAKELDTDFEYHISLRDNKKLLEFPLNDLHKDQTVIITE